MAITSFFLGSVYRVYYKTKERPRFVARQAVIKFILRHQSACLRGYTYNL